MSWSQLCIEQHNDPEIYHLFEKALNEDEISQNSVCLYTINGMLMRK